MASKMDSLTELLSQRWPGVLFRQHPDLTLESASQHLLALTGCSLLDWKSQPGLFWSIIHELDTEVVKQHLAQLAPPVTEKSCTFRVRHKSTGQIAHISEYRRTRHDQSGRLIGYEGYWIDITQQTLIESRLATAAWKETLGLLTLGLAHDFNNLLAGIMGLSEAFLGRIDAGHPFHEGLQLVHRNTQHAAQLIRQIAQLHREKPGTYGYHDLNALVTENAALIKKVIPKWIGIDEDLCPGQLPLYVDRIELQQILVGFALNAAEAMPDHGKITLRTFEATQPLESAHRVGITPRPPLACIEIADTGRGIKTRHLPFLFDPFFTTKPRNQGSGLGLYTARLFIEKHRGQISVETEEGKGAIFRLWFPIADFNEADEALELANRRPRSLLLIGAPGNLMDSTAGLLRSRNYHVVTSTSDMPEALQSGHYRFDGVVILANPQSDPTEAVLRYLRSQKLSLKIILKISGTEPDALSPEIARQCDLIITPEMPENQVATKLAATFDLRISA